MRARRAVSLQTPTATLSMRSDGMQNLTLGQSWDGDLPT
jgi:hypothetical protein